MRLLAPLLVASTVVLLGTGVALLALGPHRHRDVVLGLHKASFLVWFFVMSVHVLVYAPRLPRIVVSRSRRAAAGAGLVAGSLLAGAALAVAAYSLAGPWLHRARDGEREGVPALERVKCTPASPSSEKPSAGPGETPSSKSRPVPPLELLAVDVEGRASDLAQAARPPSPRSSSPSRRQIGELPSQQPPDRKSISGPKVAVRLRSTVTAASVATT